MRKEGELLNKICIFLCSIYEQKVSLIEVNSDFKLKDFYKVYQNTEVKFVYNVESENMLNLDLTFQENTVLQADYLIYG